VSSVATKHLVFSNLLPRNDSFAVIRFNGNVLSDPLLSNGCLLRLHHSRYQPSRHSTISLRPTTSTSFLEPMHLLYCLKFSIINSRELFTPGIWQHCHQHFELLRPLAAPQQFEFLANAHAFPTAQFSCTPLQDCFNGLLCRFIPGNILNVEI
jgi:hypothetical protein